MDEQLSTPVLTKHQIADWIRSEIFTHEYNYLDEDRDLWIFHILVARGKYSIRIAVDEDDVRDWDKKLDEAWDFNDRFMDFIAEGGHFELEQVNII